MGVKMKAMLILTVMVCLLCAAGFAQKKETMEELSNRVKILEGQKENLEKQAELLKEQFEVQSKELLLLAEEIRWKQEKNNWIAYLFGFIGIMGIGSIIGFFAWVRKFISNKVKEKAEKLINEKYKEKERELLEMAEKQSEEFRLKEEKAILVISKNETDTGFLKRFFKEMGFSSVTYEIIDNIKSLKKCDLVLFNNEKVSIQHDELLNIVAKTEEDKLCFYFGPDRFDFKDFKDRGNFANSRVQLYGNLINSLRYQSLLK